MTDELHDELEPHHFVAPAAVLAELEMDLEDLADPDARSFAIRHEHPEFDEALENELEEVDLGFDPINPGLHLAMHEIVAAQLWEGDPPEVWETAVRLRDAGYERNEILHMLGRPVTDHVWSAWHENQPYDRARHIAALRALPRSWEWEWERSTMSANRSHDAARKQAGRAAREARRRNRRPKH